MENSSKTQLFNLYLYTIDQIYNKVKLEGNQSKSIRFDQIRS